MNNFGERIKLDLGSGNPKEGEIQPKGFILQDIEPHEGIDLVCDILNLRQHISEGQCSTIRASHILEHFPTAEIPYLFKMIRDLLEDGGKLEIHVPNFKWHASLLLFDQDKEAITYAYGGQRDKYDFHKTAFTPSILAKYLADGFRLDKMEVEASIHAYATKL